MRKLIKSVRRLAGRVAEKPYVRSVYGPLLLRRPDDGTFMICWKGRYGTFTSDILRDFDRPFVFLDLGANLGLYSLIAETNENARRIFAFEPVPETFSYLARNIVLNGCRKIAPFCGAIAGEDERLIVAMTVEPHHSGISHIAHSADGGVLTPAFHARHLDALLRDWPDLPIVAKVDVEGSETLVLETLCATSFFGRVTHFIVEINNHYHEESAQADLIGRLTRAGFSEGARREHPKWRYYDALYVRTAQP